MKLSTHAEVATAPFRLGPADSQPKQTRDQRGKEKHTSEWENRPSSERKIMPPSSVGSQQKRRLYSIAIVGSGLGGLSAAIAFRRAGHHNHRL